MEALPQPTSLISVSDEDIPNSPDTDAQTKRTRIPNRQLNDFHTFAMRTSVPDTSPTPMTAYQALKTDQAEEWWQAMINEIEGLVSLNVGDEITMENILSEWTVLDSKFTCKSKLDALGKVIKKKARLVTFGDQEVLPPNTNLFSPTANDKSVKLFFALCAYLGLKIVGFDVYLAFLYPLIRRHIVVRLPKQIMRNGTRIYWKLNKTLYGLKDSPRIFNEEMTALLRSNGYIQCSGDPCIFFMGQIKDQNFIIMVLIVDDFAAAAYLDDSISRLRVLLKSKYTIVCWHPRFVQLRQIHHTLYARVHFQIVFQISHQRRYSSGHPDDHFVQ